VTPPLKKAVFNISRNRSGRTGECYFNCNIKTIILHPIVENELMYFHTLLFYFYCTSCIPKMDPYLLQLDKAMAIGEACNFGH